MRIEQGPIKHQHDGSPKLCFEIIIPASVKPGDALKLEAQLQAALNEAACLAMEHCLSRFDTMGEPILLGGRNYTSKGQSPAIYQCLGGPVSISRHVYQNSKGGTTFCPLEDRPRMINDTRPHFASIVSGKYSEQSGRAVVTDLARAMQRDVGLEYVQNLSKGLRCASVSMQQFTSHAGHTQIFGWVR